MHIENLSLINFKNYEEASVTFSKSVNCILGKNGSGKTNLLDAIYYLSSTKSYFNTVDSQNIKFEEQFFSVKGTLHVKDESFMVHCYLKEGKKKTIKVNNVEYEKLRAHIGRFPAIFITPYDTDLVREGSEIRRKFFDQVISQTDNQYLDALIEYNHYLKQRNSLLKRFAETNTLDKLLLEPYDQKLLTTGAYLNNKRSAFLETFKTHFFTELDKITDEKEVVDLVYDSDFNADNFEGRFNGSLQKDLALQRTTFGVHRDDYKFFIKGKPLKKFGSQGQQKSFVIGLKLAHYATLKSHNDFGPILLLDDIFDKLDTNRIQRLIEMIVGGSFDQIFITDARSQRTKELLNDSDIPVNFYEISGGEVKAPHEEKRV